jgi:hypothetical protein
MLAVTDRLKRTFILKIYDRSSENLVRDPVPGGAVRKVHFLLREFSIGDAAKPDGTISEPGRS